MPGRFVVTESTLSFFLIILGILLKLLSVRTLGELLNRSQFRVLIIILSLLSLVKSTTATSLSRTLKILLRISLRSRTFRRRSIRRHLLLSLTVPTSLLAHGSEVVKVTLDIRHLIALGSDLRIQEEFFALV